MMMNAKRALVLVLVVALLITALALAFDRFLSSRHHAKRTT